MGSAPSVQIYDPAQVAQLQGQYNEQTGVESQLMSEVGQNTPYGTLSYNQTGSYFDPLTGQNVPIESATTNLSPVEQQLLGTGQGTQQAAATGANNLISGANYGAVSPTTAIGNETSGLMGGAENQFQSYEQPFFSQQTEALQSQLANQGLTPSSPAYKTAMNNLMQSQGQTTSGFLAEMEPQAFNQAQTLYQEPATLGQSLFQTGAPANLTANLINTPTASVSPDNVTGAYASAQQAQEAEAQLAEQQYMGMLTGLGGVGAAGLMAL